MRAGARILVAERLSTSGVVFVAPFMVESFFDIAQLQDCMRFKDFTRNEIDFFLVYRIKPNTNSNVKILQISSYQPSQLFQASTTAKDTSGHEHSSKPG